ncbi:MAG: response regulator transcription factor [Bacteroides sp.]|jgi:DNA-binding response OmpR family regulator|nr:response regulator transcription factor [Bacteroides sp.]
MNVLIVEDEKSLAQEIADFLSKEHYLVEVSTTGMDASEKIAVNLYDFILLDLGLPDYDGLDLLREAREINHEAAFIIITARGEVDDRIKGLDLGADDYLAKPFSLAELNARMAAIARRKFGMKTNHIQFGDFLLDPLSRKVTCQDIEVDITKKQFDLLHYLLLSKNRALTRMQLYEHVWGNLLGDEYDSNFIDVHIKNLRKKLAEYAPVDWLETVRGVGYRANID